MNFPVNLWWNLILTSADGKKFFQLNAIEKVLMEMALVPHCCCISLTMEIHTTLSKEWSFVNVSNQLSRVIAPTRLFWERFNTARNVSYVNYREILASSFFKNRSKDSSAVKFPSDDGIWPVKLSSNDGIWPIKLLWEKLRTNSEFSSPSPSGMSPSNWLFEKSMSSNMQTFHCHNHRMIPFKPFMVESRTCSELRLQSMDGITQGQHIFRNQELATENGGETSCPWTKVGTKIKNFNFSCQGIAVC